MAKRQRAPIAPAPAAPSLWTDSYAPNRQADLIIRKNKVEEFCQFLESPATVCVLTAPAGSGKSTLIRVCCAERNIEVVEYIAKVQQQRQDDVGFYESKLEAYESFCSRAWMPTLDDEGASTSHRRHKSLVVLDDIPTVVGEDQERRLVNATLGLVARSPKVVVAVTEISSKDTAEHYSSAGGKWENSSIPKVLTVALEKFYSPLTVSLNPIPKATMVKHLASICDREMVQINKEDLQTLWEHSQGDLSSALLGLQFATRGLTGTAGTASAGNRRPAARRRNAAGAGSTAAAATTAGTATTAMTATTATTATTAATTTAGNGVDVLAHMVRDSSLSVFHGLGKLLYNKRLPYPESEPTGLHTGAPRTARDRPPMDGFDPEDTVYASGLSGPSVTAFLHENILDFIDPEHVDDVAQCLDHLSLADVLSSKMDRTPYFGTAQDEPDGTRGLQDMLSSIVASRGVCYWNTHPAPRSWKPLKGPTAFRAERGRRANAVRLCRAASVNRVEYGGATSQSSCAAMSTEILPYVRGMGIKDVLQQPQKWDRYWQGKCIECDNWPGGPAGTTAGGAGVVEDEDPIEN